MRVENPIPSGQYSDPVSVPRRGISKVFTVVGIIAALAAGFFWGVNFDGNWPPNVITHSLDYSSLDEIYSVLRQNYDGEIDTEQLLEGARRGMVEGLGDEYTQYFSAAESREFYDSIEGNFEGIGAELLNKDGKLTINGVLEGTPAKAAGLLAGDLIAKVDDEETIAWSAESAVQIIRGPAGTNVRLTIIRGVDVLEFDITRAKIINPSTSYEIIDGIGYLRIGRFNDTDTTQLSRQAAKAFTDAKVSGVILDLRGNGGGYVSTAVDVASLWLDRGQPIVIEKFGETVTDTETASGNNILSGIPTVVLIDGQSASASEIVAGALSDGGKATLVGTNSFGKGSVQIMHELRSGSQLKITIARWYTPNGLNINQEGIAPDVEIEFDSEQYKNGIDVQELKAIEVLRSE